MDFTKIMDVIVKGVGISKQLIEAGQDAAPAIKAVYDLATGAKNGTATAADIESTEATLDAMIEDFNTDLDE